MRSNNKINFLQLHFSQTEFSIRLGSNNHNSRNPHKAFRHDISPTNIRVDYYGAPTPLKQLAAVSTPEARLIVIQPWDKAVMPEIEKALLKSDLGITPTNDGKVIRLSMPPLTQERRQELDKVLKKIAEDGHVSIRTARHAAIELARKSEKDKIITEDEKFKVQDDIQKLTDKYIKEIDNMLAVKEKEIAG